ncbi:hypothetical protein AJ87_46185 [Rhizobium yanglingense]|nr:hypothetical protein AJ87_46185 [Rhizobium yanglingense]
MTNIRFKGFDSPTQLREHLADVEEGTPADDLAEDIPGEDELQSALREVAWLRKTLPTCVSSWPCSLVSSTPWRGTVSAPFRGFAWG